jgi:hypothetical protein
LQIHPFLQTGENEVARTGKQNYSRDIPKIFAAASVKARCNGIPRDVSRHAVIDPKAASLGKQKEGVNRVHPLQILIPFLLCSGRVCLAAIYPVRAPVSGGMFLVLPGLGHSGRWSKHPQAMCPRTLSDYFIAHHQSVVLMAIAHHKRHFA